MYRVGDIVLLPLDDLDNPVREVLRIDPDGSLVIRYPDTEGTHRWNPNVGVAPTVVIPKLEVGDYVVERSRPNGRPMRVTMAPRGSLVRADRYWWNRATLTRVDVDGAAARKLLDDGADPVELGEAIRATSSPFIPYRFVTGLEETETTLEKVYDALKAAGVDAVKRIDAVNEMQSRGVLFRERAKPPLPTEIGAVISDVVTRSGRRFIRAMRGKQCWFVMGLDGTWASFLPDEITSWKSS